MDITNAKVSVNPIVVDPCTVKLEIEVPVEIAKPIYNKVMKDVGAKANLPGFRRGKLPVSILTKYYGSNIQSETADKLIQKGYADALNELQYSDRVVNRPELVSELDLYKDGEPYKFTIEVELSPEVELPEYKGLQLSKTVRTVSDADVDKQVDNMLDMCTRYEETEDGVAERGDVLTASYKAVIPEGLELTEDANHYVNVDETWLALREPEIMPGISTALLGVKKDDEKEVDISYPEDWRVECLRGKTLHYNFVIKTVRKTVRPELNDDFVKQFGSDNVEDFKSLIRKRFELNMKNETQNELFKQIEDLYFANIEMPLPPKLLENTKKEILKQSLEEQKNKGISKEEMAEKLTEMEKEAEEKAKKSLTFRFASEAIIKKENVRLEKEDYDQIIRYISSQAPEGQNSAKFIKQQQESGAFYNAINNSMVVKLLEKIVELAEVVEVQPAEN